MKFSIATPVLEGMPQIKRCVGSVRGQQNVEAEHIIQDACSTDGTAGWLSNQHDLSCKSERDSGMYDAINRCWGRASGDILCWLNADEQYLPGTLSFVESVFVSNPNVDVVYGNAIVVDSGGQALAARREVPLRHLYISNSFLNIYSCTIFFRRKLWDNNLLKFGVSLRYAADTDLVLRLLQAGVRTYQGCRYLSLFGVHADNLSTHDQMQKETREVQLVHNALSFAWQRQFVVTMRRFERLIRGCYRRVSLSYDYSLNEIPEYQHIDAENVGGRFDIRKYTSR